MSARGAMRYGTWEEYPFPLSTGGILWLRIPGAHLSATDAERLCEYVRTLVIDADHVGEMSASGEDAFRD